MKRRTTYHQTYYHFAKTCQGWVIAAAAAAAVCRYERQAFEWPEWMRLEQEEKKRRGECRMDLHEDSTAVHRQQRKYRKALNEPRDLRLVRPIGLWHNLKRQKTYGCLVWISFELFQTLVLFASFGKWQVKDHALEALIDYCCCLGWQAGWVVVLICFDAACLYDFWRVLPVFVAGHVLFEALWVHLYIHLLFLLLWILEIQGERRVKEK